MTDLRQAALLAWQALDHYRSSEDYQPTPASLAIDALRQALDHLPDATKMMQEPDVYGDGNVYRGQRSKDSTTKTLHYTAQPEAEKQEPVAWMSPNKERLEFSRKDTVHGSHTIPLYTAPPEREWVELTDEEGICDEWERITGHNIDFEPKSEGRAMYLSADEVIEFARAIEAKLKEKNK